MPKKGMLDVDRLASDCGALDLARRSMRKKSGVDLRKAPRRSKHTRFLLYANRRQVRCRLDSDRLVIVFAVNVERFVGVVRESMVEGKRRSKILLRRVMQTF